MWIWGCTWKVHLLCSTCTQQHWDISHLPTQGTVKKSQNSKKYPSYLLLHHHLQRLSPEKNTTECHFLLQLLKKREQFNENEPPQSSRAGTQWLQDCTFQSCVRPLPHNHTAPSPPFSSGYCFCQPSMQRFFFVKKQGKKLDRAALRTNLKFKRTFDTKLFSYLSGQNPPENTHTHTLRT